MNTSKTRTFLLTLISLVLMGNEVLSQNVPKVEAQPAFCYDNTSPTPISQFVTVTGDDSSDLQGLQVSISQNYNSTTDLLSFQNQNGITGSFDSDNGILTLTGTASLADYRALLDDIYFSTTAQGIDAIKSINISLSNVDFLTTNGHFYQFFPQVRIRWTEARDAAAAKELFGLKGYLATITTKAENDFILARVSGTTWLGGSDEVTEGDWRWVTGPEGKMNGGLGRPISAGFTNWNDGEPNNNLGDENYLHMVDKSEPPGRWNDLPDPGSSGNYEPKGYIVEYGGQAGDPNVLNSISGTTQLDPLKEMNLIGSISVCPNIMGVTYTVEDLPGYSYVWSITGGTIASGQGDHEITVDWGDTNAAALVSVTAVSDIVCEIKAELQVRINEQLVSPLFGPAFVCFEDLNIVQTYSTPETPGSHYEWKITNGRFVSPNGTNEIEVLWDGPGEGELYFTESTSTITDICYGDSRVLKVDLREEIIPTLSITQVSCYDGSDGTVVLSSIEGAQPVTLHWNTNAQGIVVNMGVVNLPAGSYSVDINSDGCVINVPFEITHPTELQGSVQQFDALCYGEASGMATVTATGGTGDYRYIWSIDRPTDQSTARNLPKGLYSVDVIDENDCVLPLHFEIDHPPLLVIDSIASTLVSCPAGSDGTLEAYVSGGTAPYTYEWEFSSDETALATGFPKGTYRVTVTDANGCQESDEQIVEEATPKIFMPNSFSPNGDESNETFGPATTCPFPFQMTVFNRWGTPIFSTTSATDQWDGTIEGVDAPVGLYSYSASWQFEVNDLQISGKKKGTLRLFR